ncbi:hypothetical protein AKO1_003229 [Acrasis kona]|uniref:K Homology domain-containing protein n=1 Tax=Acrasis kona TaxID=1008807 RepID=A0AAW2ZKN6_9EUKA
MTKRGTKWDVPDFNAPAFKKDSQNQPKDSSKRPKDNQQQSKHQPVSNAPPSASDLAPGMSLATVYDSITGLPHTTIVKEIEINDCRNRYILTKGATISEINKETGAVISVRGRYYRDGEPRDPAAAADDRPLFLHVAADTQESINKAAKQIEEIMVGNAGIPPGMIIAKIPIDIDLNNPNASSFSIAASIIGPKGQFLKHITSQTGGTRVQLKGRGFKENGGNTVKEVDEPMHLQLSSNGQQNLEKAKKLATSLIEKTLWHTATGWKRTRRAAAQQASYGGYYTYGTGYIDPYVNYYNYASQPVAPATEENPSTPTATNDKKRPLEDDQQPDSKKVKIDNDATLVQPTPNVEQDQQQQQQLDWASMDPATRQYYENYYAQYYAQVYAQGYQNLVPTENGIMVQQQPDVQVQELLQEIEKELWKSKENTFDSFM